jgi:ABC-2 type transport system ATP-binding protein
MAEPTSLAIAMRDVHKTYRDDVALRAMNLDVPRGAIFGLVGKNGAGKSTAFNIVAGLLRKDAGRVSIEGRDLDHDGESARTVTAFVPEQDGLYPWMTGEELAGYWSRLSHTWDAAAFRASAERFDLPLRRQAGKLSKGMRTQLLFALAIGKQPTVYILDEPTASLDPVVRREVVRVFKEQVARFGRTILFSSHVLAEIEDVCTHVAVLDRGRVVLSSELALLRPQWRRYEFASPIELREDTLKSVGATHWESSAGRYSVVVAGDQHQAVAMIAEVAADSPRVTTLDLEEIFFQVVDAREESAKRL